MLPHVSLCMIVKNEEANLAACLDTSADLVDEIVVVDTGSIDRTKEVAGRYGARVHDFAWVDDFAAARNESLRHATAKWIFWLDADDRIDEVNRPRLRDLLAALPDENIAYLMTCLGLREASPGQNSAADHVRLFRNHPQIRWQYRVHEQILPAVERQGGRACLADVTIHHLGYQDPALVRGKLERNLRLLQMDHADHPPDPDVLFNLGRTLLRLEMVTEAIPVLRQAVAALNPALVITPIAYALLVEALARLGQHAAALELCLEGRARCPNDHELLRGEAMMRLSLGDMVGGEVCLVRLLERDPTNAHARSQLARLRPARTFQISMGM
jgi:tetratricopeptide (TPR) repeat protein